MKSVAKQIRSGLWDETTLSKENTLRLTMHIRFKFSRDWIDMPASLKEGMRNEIRG